MTSETVIGEIHNHGHMPMGGSQTYQISQSNKRYRTLDKETTYRVFEYWPGMSHDMTITTDEGTVHLKKTCVEAFDIDQPLFWHLWARHSDYMLHAGDGVPLTDLYAFLSWCGDTFYLCEWTPEHEHLRGELNRLKYTQILEEIEEDISAAQKKVDYHIERKEECLLRLNQYKQI
jgi:hypothetical protein